MFWAQIKPSLIELVTLVIGVFSYFGRKVVALVFGSIPQVGDNGRQLGLLTFTFTRLNKPNEGDLASWMQVFGKQQAVVHDD